MGRGASAFKGSKAMRVEELGRLDVQVMLFGGPYSNLQAMRAVARCAAERGIEPRAMICTGDVVAYGANPVETIAEIRRLGAVVVAGNCERQLAAHRPDCGCGFAAGSTCDRLSAGWFAHADAAVGEADRKWMAGLPDAVTFTHEGQRNAVIHGGLTDISRFLWPVDPETAFAEEVEALQALSGPVDRVIAGHCGLAFRRDVGDVEWINAGVIGLPPNDGRQQTEYAVLDSGRVSLHRLDYEADTAAAAMRAAGLTQGYETAILSGYWPSEEVLPPALRRAALARG